MILVLLNVLLEKDTKKPGARIISVNRVRSLNLNFHIVFLVSILWITFLSLPKSTLGIVKSFTPKF